MKQDETFRGDIFLTLAKYTNIIPSCMRPSVFFTDIRNLVLKLSKYEFLLIKTLGVNFLALPVRQFKTST